RSVARRQGPVQGLGRLTVSLVFHFLHDRVLPACYNIPSVGLPHTRCRDNPHPTPRFLTTSRPCSKDPLFGESGEPGRPNRSVRGRPHGACSACVDLLPSPADLLGGGPRWLVQPGLRRGRAASA